MFQLNTDSECPIIMIHLQIELSTSFSWNVASLTTGIAVDYLSVWDCGHLFGLRFNELLKEFGIEAVDRLYPLKPKNPI